MQDSIKISKIDSQEAIYDALYKLKSNFYSFSGDIRVFSEKIAKYGICISAENDNGLLGLIAFYANDTATYTAFITSILVSDSAQRKGIGTMLLDSAEECARSLGMTKERLEVNITNKKAIQFYIKHNFSIIKISGESYFMEKSLGDVNHAD